VDCAWNPPSENTQLSDHEVHIWCVCLPAWFASCQQLLDWLTADEQARASRFRFEKHRQSFIVGRGLLRVILGRYLSLEPSQLQFSYNAHGKPSLAETFGNEAMQFNVSHSHEVALYAFTRDRRIGIDVEHIRPVPDADHIVERFFSDRESALFQSLAIDCKEAAFFRGWTQKEAYLKAIGEGLAYPLRNVEVSLSPHGPAQLLSIENDPEAAHQWYFQDLQPVPHYMAALAVEQRPNEVSMQPQCFYLRPGGC
jgi:4'-phosphopantetheinyl transferase